MELRNPFGIRNNQIVLIEDIPKNENGLRCNCICPACKEPFEARMGDVRRHHFAHSGQGCDEINAYLTGLYMLLNEYLSSGQLLYLPPVIVAYELSAQFYLSEDNIREHTFLLSDSKDRSHEICLFPNSLIRFESSIIVKDANQKPKAILAQKGDKQLAIRITPPDTVCKIGKASQFQNYPTLEIDLSSAAMMLQTSHKEDVFKYLMTEHSIYYWIFNPRMAEAYPQIIKRSKAYYDEAQARMKRAAEKRQEDAIRLAEFQRKAEEQSRLRAEELQHQLEEKQNQKSEREKRRKEEKYALGLSDVKELFTQQQKIIKDRFGNRWVKCEECGAIKQDVEFASYGGGNHINLGICKECSRKQSVH